MSALEAVVAGLIGLMSLVRELPEGAFQQPLWVGFAGDIIIAECSPVLMSKGIIGYALSEHHGPSAFCNLSVGENVFWANFGSKRLAAAVGMENYASILYRVNAFADVARTNIRIKFICVNERANDRNNSRKREYVQGWLPPRIGDIHNELNRLALLVGGFVIGEYRSNPSPIGFDESVTQHAPLSDSNSDSSGGENRNEHGSGSGPVRRLIFSGCELVLGAVGIGIGLHKICGYALPRWRVGLPLLLISGVAIAHGMFHALMG